jgi:hypothetical protein
LGSQVVERVEIDRRGGKLNGGIGVFYDVVNLLSRNSVDHVDIRVREQLIRPFCCTLDLQYLRV